MQCALTYVQTGISLSQCVVFIDAVNVKGCKMSERSSHEDVKEESSHVTGGKKRIRGSNYF